MDVFSDVLRRLQLRGSAYFCSDFHGAWGMDEAASERGSFHIVMRGSAWIQVADSEAQTVGPGDILVLPHGDAHWLADRPQAQRQPGRQVVEAIRQGEGPFEEGPLGATLICGYFDYDSQLPHGIFKSLPALLRLRTDGLDDSGWLVSAVRALSAEARNPRPGMEAIVDRLTEVMIIEVLRRWLQDNSPDTGLLSALADEKLARALVAIHAEPEYGWSVTSLAERAGMSRAGFAQRFQQRMDQSPMLYLTHWRMALARELFAQGKSLLEVALALGYKSEVAFAKSFKKVTGITPGQARRH